MTKILIASEFIKRLLPDLDWHAKGWKTRRGDKSADVYWALTENVPENRSFIFDDRNNWLIDGRKAQAYFTSEVYEAWSQGSTGMGVLSRKPQMISWAQIKGNEYDRWRRKLDEADPVPSEYSAPSHDSNAAEALEFRNHARLLSAIVSECTQTKLQIRRDYGMPLDGRRVAIGKISDTLKISKDAHKAGEAERRAELDMRDAFAEENQRFKAELNRIAERFNIKPYGLPVLQANADPVPYIPRSIPPAGVQRAANGTITKGTVAVERFNPAVPGVGRVYK